MLVPFVASPTREFTAETKSTRAPGRLPVNWRDARDRTAPLFRSHAGKVAAEDEIRIGESISGPFEYRRFQAFSNTVDLGPFPSLQLLTAFGRDVWQKPATVIAKAASFCGPEAISPSW